MTALMQVLFSLFLLVVAIGFGLWIVAFWGVLPFMLVVIAVLIGYRLPKEHRQSQWPLPLTALIFSLSYWGLLLWLRNQYLGLAASHAIELNWFGAGGIDIPKDIGRFIPLMNALFLALYAILKALFIIVRRHSLPSYPKGVPFGIAYAFQYDIPRGWILKPGWICIRWMCIAAATVGLSGLCLVWLASIGEVKIAWVPLFLGGFFLFALETALWLGGRLADKWQPEFSGSDVDTVG